MSQVFVLLNEFRCTFAKFETLFFICSEWPKQYYDDLNRLTKEARAGTSTNYTYQYWYDAVGNRTKMDKDETETSYYYDAENRLTKKTFGGANTTYEYSYNGNMKRKRI